MVDVKSKYCYDDIVKDLDWHDSSKNKIKFSEHLDAIENRNYVFEKKILKKIDEIWNKILCFRIIVLTSHPF